MEEQTPPSTPPEISNDANNWKKTLVIRKKKIIISGVVVLIILGFVIFLLAQKNGGLFSNGIFNNSGSSDKSSLNGDQGKVGSDDDGKSGDEQKPDNAIAKVGKEYIFQRDLDYELTFQPGAKTDELKKMLTQKLVGDSVALQAAQQEKLVSLGNTEFNVEAKDYQKRFDTIRDIRKTVDNRIDHISGTMVSVWFNNMKPAKIGLEQGKQEAFKRISALHQRVVDKEITIEQAGNAIKNDPSYDSLDFGYMNNALYEFNFPKGRQITFDKGYDEILWKTNSGDLTEVYLGKTVNEFSGKEEESFYIFALVKEKVDRGNGLDYQKWVEKQKKNYEINIY